MNELLVIGSLEPARVQAAGEGHLHPIAVFIGYLPATAHPVEGAAIDAGDIGYVFGRLEPPFNLQ